MAWTDPRTWVTSELVTAAILNTHIRDNSRELWRETFFVAFSTVGGTPGNAGIYGGNSGTRVATVTSRSYNGSTPVVIELQTQRVYEAVTADGAWYLGLHDGSADYPSGPLTPNVYLLGSGSSAGPGSGLFSHRFVPTAGTHAYSVYLWSGNGTGSDSAVCEPGYLRMLERGV